jgi:hypothetical protein
MSKETPKSDPRQQTDWNNTRQTDQPWKGPVEKEQKNEVKSAWKSGTILTPTSRPGFKERVYGNFK